MDYVPSEWDNDVPSGIVSRDSLKSMHSFKKRTQTYSDDDEDDDETLSINFQSRSRSRTPMYQHADRSKSKLHRIYSETEKRNFDGHTGARLWDDMKHRPSRTQSPVLGQPRSRRHSSESGKRPAFACAGMTDEYIPDFDFASSLQKWTEDDGPSPSMSLHAQVEPIPMGGAFPRRKYARSSTTSVSEYNSASPALPQKRNKWSFSGEELTPKEMVALASLPENFLELPFSQRKKLLTDLLPDSDIGHVQQLVRKKSRGPGSFIRSRQSSVASQFLNSFTKPSQLSVDDRGANVMGYRLGNVIGHGAWGMVRECTALDSNHVMAMKIVKTKRAEISESFKREVSIWRQLHNEYILPLKQVSEIDGTSFCLMPKINGGSLYDLVMSWGICAETKISHKERCQLTNKYAWQIAKGLEYMHGMHIVHGDVKLENVMLENGKVVICDFGMSCSCDSSSCSPPKYVNTGNELMGVSLFPKKYGPSLTSTSLASQPTSPLHSENNSRLDLREDAKLAPHSHIGSLPYAAPELLDPKPGPLAPPADVWALGVTVYTMLVGQLPFKHQYEPRLRAMIERAKYDTEQLEKVCQPGHGNLVSVVAGCLTKDVAKRWKLERIESELGEREV